MLSLLLLQGLFDFSRYLSIGIDAAIYFLLALIATLIFLIKLALQFFFGGVDADFDAGGVDAHIDSTGAFTFFSVLSVLAFFMGVGWMGLTCRVSWGLGAALSATAATAFGLVLMSISSGLMYMVRRMTEVGRYDVNTAIGATGQVYLTVPASGQGRGQVEVTVSGRRKVMAAVTTGDQIPAFTPVKIVAVGDDETFVVERIS